MPSDKAPETVVQLGDFTEKNKMELISTLLKTAELATDIHNRIGHYNTFKATDPSGKDRYFIEQAGIRIATAMRELKRAEDDLTRFENSSK